jgi:hypothetical protein
METIYHNRGDTLSIIIECQKNDGTPLDITGFEFFATMKRQYDNDSTDSAAPFKKNWSVHADPTNGKTLLQATAAEMDIPTKTYLMDVQCKIPSVNDEPSIILTPAQFYIFIQNTVTNRIS